MRWLLAFASPAQIRGCRTRFTKIRLATYLLPKCKRGKLDSLFPEHLTAMRCYQCQANINHMCQSLVWCHSQWGMNVWITNWYKTWSVLSLRSTQRMSVDVTMHVSCWHTIAQTVLFDFLYIYIYTYVYCHGQVDSSLVRSCVLIWLVYRCWKKVGARSCQ